MSRLLVRLQRGDINILDARLDVLSSVTVKPGHLSKLGPALFRYYRVVEKRPSPSFTVARPCVVVTAIAAVSTANKVRVKGS